MARAAVAPSYAAMVLSDGAVSYWRLGDSGTSLRDTASGAIATQQVGAGAAYQQSGALPGDSDGSIQNSGTAYWSTPSPHPSVQMAGGGSYTVEFWIKPSTIDGNFRPVVACRTGTPDGWYLWLHNQAPLIAGLEMYKGGAQVRGGYLGLAGGTPSLQLNQWQHVVFINDATGITTYLNGILNSVYGGVWIPIGIGPNLTISADWNGNSPYLGNLDELAFYSTSLTAAQVRAHYLAGLSIPRPGNDYKAVVLSDLPQAYWRLNEASSPMGDSAGGSYPLTGFGSGGSFRTAPATNDGDFSFTNSSAAYLDGGNVLDPGDGSFSWECWFNPTAFDGTYRILMGKQSGTDGYVVRYQNTVGIQVSRLAAGVAGDAHTSVNLSTGAWHHVVTTFDKPSAALKVYVDGVFGAGGAGGYTGTVAKVATSFRLMADSVGTSNVLGSLDEAAVYNYALNATQVLRRYQTGLRGKARATAGARSTAAARGAA